MVSTQIMMLALQRCLDALTFRIFESSGLPNLYNHERCHFLILLPFLDFQGL